MQGGCDDDDDDDDDEGGCGGSGGGGEGKRTSAVPKTRPTPRMGQCGPTNQACRRNARGHGCSGSGASNVLSGEVTVAAAPTRACTQGGTATALAADDPCCEEAGAPSSASPPSTVLINRCPLATHACLASAFTINSTGAWCVPAGPSKQGQRQRAPSRSTPVVLPNPPPPQVCINTPPPQLLLQFGHVHSKPPLGSSSSYVT